MTICTKKNTHLGLCKKLEFRGSLGLAQYHKDTSIMTSKGVETEQGAPDYWLCAPVPRGLGPVQPRDSQVTGLVKQGKSPGAPFTPTGFAAWARATAFSEF